MMIQELNVPTIGDPPFQAVGVDADDSALLRKAFGCFPTGVVGICAMSEGKPIGMAASSFVSVSIAPPLVAFCVQWTSKTWAKLEAVKRVGISVLGEGHDVAAQQLASRTEDKFSGLELGISEDGAVFIAGATAWIDCLIDSVVPAGDHGIVLLRVNSLTMRNYVEPLVFHGSKFRQLEKNLGMGATPAVE
jgi:flavin reductase (DIM6/NTAB) family NADH-FMN oxidoreductase RutF